MSDTREQYMNAWRTFAELAQTVPDHVWDAASPHTDWTARQLVGHVIDGSHQVQAMITRQAGQRPVTDPAQLARRAGPNPASAAQAAAEAVTSTVTVLDADHMVITPRGELPLRQVLAIAIIEPVVHAWDLASASGQVVAIDEQTVEALLAGVERLGGQLAATGMYAPALPVPPNAAPLPRLLAALGRRAG